MLDRIPGFAICSHCGARRDLGACDGCGLLSCHDCRCAGQCVTCYRENAARLRRIIRRGRIERALRRATVIGCVALSGAAAVGAAVLPERPAPLFADEHTELVARGEVRFVGDAVQRYSDLHGGVCPSSLRLLRREGYLMAAPLDPWGEPLLFGCVEGPRAFVVLSKGADRELGTDDDLLFTAP